MKRNEGKLVLKKATDGTMTASGSLSDDMSEKLGAKASASLRKAIRSGSRMNESAVRAVLADAMDKDLASKILGFSKKQSGSKGSTLRLGGASVKNPVLAKSGSQMSVEGQKYKYPRTFHLPWSETLGADDKRIAAEEIKHNFEGKRIIVTEKMDGQNTTIYSDGSFHARSVSENEKVGGEHMKHLKQLAQQVKAVLPEGYRIAGENLYAKHAVDYDDLPDHFMVFSIWDGSRNLSWDETKEMVKMLNEDMKSRFGPSARQLHLVPVLYDGKYDEETLKALPKQMNLHKQEGYVVRNADEFEFEDFGKNMAKYVRGGHVAPDEKHWKQKGIQPNKIKTSDESLGKTS